MERDNPLFALPGRPRAMFAHQSALDNPPLPHPLAGEVPNYVRTATIQGTPGHDAERGIWQRPLHVGRTTLGHFFALQGTGDLGDTVTLPDGQTCQRLPQPHTRRYLSTFGEFTPTRTAYGSR